MRTRVYEPRRVQRSHPMVRRLLFHCAWWPSRWRCIRDVQVERRVWKGYVEQLEGARQFSLSPYIRACVHIGSPFHIRHPDMTLT